MHLHITDNAITYLCITAGSTRIPSAITASVRDDVGVCSLAPMHFITRHIQGVIQTPLIKLVILLLTLYCTRSSCTTFLHCQLILFLLIYYLSRYFTHINFSYCLRYTYYNNTILYFMHAILLIPLSLTIHDSPYIFIQHTILYRHVTKT